MGTSGAYTGAGGKAGKEIGEGLTAWVDSLPDGPSGADEDNPDGSPAEGDRAATPLPTTAVTGLLGLLRSRTGGAGSADGPGGGGGAAGGGGVGKSGGGGKTRAGSGRSAQRLSAVGGRAAAGAYAFARGDAGGLQGLGLNYGELRALDDPIEVTRRIVDAVCGERADNTLESEEERYVAAAIADWILIESQDGALLELEEISRYAISTIMAEVLSSELAVALRDRPDDVRTVAEDELRDAASVLADQADLSPTGPTASEFQAAIDGGIEVLRTIYGPSK